MRLVICGNGFDLHHGLKTRYLDYWKYLCNNEADVLEKLSKSPYFEFGFDKLVESSCFFWTCVEDNLKYDFHRHVENLIDQRLHDAWVKSQNMSLEDILNDATPELPIDLDMELNCMPSLASFSGMSLYRWLSTIDLEKVKKDPSLNLDSNALYINFNYTDTLEKVYGICQENILHIHGRLGDVISPSKDRDVHQILQFGNPFITPTLVSLDLSQVFMNSELAYQSQHCIGEMSNFIALITKDLPSNKEKMNAFVEKNGINEVVIMGHSYLGVDNYYYNNILIPLFKKAKWTIYCHVDEEIVKAKKFLSEKYLRGETVKW